MRILLLSQWFDPEPGAIRGLPLASWLVRQGHDVEVITGFPNYPGGKVYDGYKIQFCQRETMDGIPVIRVPLYPSHSRSSLGRLVNYISFAMAAAFIGVFKAQAADIAFVIGPPPTLGLPAFFLKYLRGIPFIYHISDMWPESAVESGMLGSGRKKQIFEWILTKWCNLVHKRAAKITVLADAPKQVMIERGVPEKKLEVVYNWADEKTFKPMPKEPELAKKLGIDLNHFNLIYAGNFGVFQNLEIAVRAAHSVQKTCPNLRLVLIGTGTEEQALKNITTELGATNVKFIGRQSYQDMPAISALSDAMLIHLSDVPLLRWTVPSKTQIALAMGIPMLMAAVSDTARIVRKAQAGVVCAPDDIISMAQAMTEIYSASPETLSNYGQNALNFYHREMSLEHGGTTMLELFKMVLAENASMTRNEKTKAF
ncbi:MAG: glycosyltransferase family 4 protein [Sphingomonadales bacterium]